MKRFITMMAAGLALALFVAAGSCTPEGEAEPGSDRLVTQLPLPENAISEDLMLALRQAKNFHHIADVYLQNANLDRAIDAVRSVLAIRFPAGAAEGEDVKLDARARLGKLLVARGELDQAMNVLDAGIDGATRESFFLSNVYTVKAEVEEARAVTLDETDRDAANQLREAAILSREKSIDIDRALQDKLLRGVNR